MGRVDPTLESHHRCSTESVSGTQENPTERTNRTVETLISQLSEDNQSSWYSMLPEISLAINSSISDSTGYTPAFLTQGRELRLPAMLYDELTPGSGVVHTGPEDKASHLKGIFDIVRSNLQRASLEQARHYNLRRREWRPTRGRVRHNHYYFLYNSFKRNTVNYNKY